MSRDVPTLDELNGPGAEEASDFADFLELLREQCLTYAKEHAMDYHTATEEIYDPVIINLRNENRRLEGNLVSAGEEIERLRAASDGGVERG
jgi:hypothetical protein